MALPLYLAQTPLEMARNPLTENLAYMALHFSPGGRGLSNLPEDLPPGTLLILDDSTPMDGHDRSQIGKQLSEAVHRFQCIALLLDFQHQDVPEQWELTKLLSNALPCPVGVSEDYAQGLSCPVFLPPVPPDKPILEYLRPWQDREIWLEAALEGLELTLTANGCIPEPLWDFPEDGRDDEKLHCHYSIDTTADAAIFRLWRNRADLDALLTEAQAHGITKAIGLWQELGR